MGGKSVFANVMLVVIALILFLGFYLVIGAVTSSASARRTWSRKSRP